MLSHLLHHLLPSFGAGLLAGGYLSYRFAKSAQAKAVDLAAKVQAEVKKL